MAGLIARWRFAALTLALMAASPAGAQDDDPAEAARRAAALYQAGSYAEALPLFERILERAEARYRKDSQQLALALNNVGELNRRLGRLDQAEPLFLRAIELAERAGGDRRGLGSSLNNLALLYGEQGRLAEAIETQKRAVLAFERSLGPDHPSAAASRDNLAALQRPRHEPPPARQVAAAPQAPRRTVAARPAKPRATTPPRSFAVLVSSMRDPAAVPEEWQMLRRQFPALASLDLRPPRPEATDSGVVYRLVAGAFRAEAQAAAVCEGLRAEGQHCRVVPR